jgi:hypothetical protein
MNMATPASAAASSVPISAAWTNGTDLRNTLRITSSQHPLAKTDGGRDGTDLPLQFSIAHDVGENRFPLFAIML